LSKPGAALHRVRRRLHLAPHRVVVADPLFQCFEVAGDDGQQVIKIVRNTDGERADPVNLLRLNERPMARQHFTPPPLASGGKLALILASGSPCVYSTWVYLYRSHV
jgi:hypothetical protein